jgi:hypothetical protein
MACGGNNGAIWRGVNSISWLSSIWRNQWQQWRQSSMWRRQLCGWPGAYQLAGKQQYNEMKTAKTGGWRSVALGGAAAWQLALQTSMANIGGISVSVSMA